MRRVDLHDPRGEFLLVICAPVAACLSAGPTVEASPIRDEYPAQPFHAEPAAQSVDEREALPRRSTVDQRLGRLPQNLVLNPKVLDLSAVMANLAAQLRDNDFKIPTAGTAC
jgi:hypothetical protein